MADKDNEQFVVVGSATLDRMQEHFSGRILLLCSEEQPGLRWSDTDALILIKIL